MFRLIRPETLPDIAASRAAEGSADVRAADADAAAARTRADYGRASRWGMGILATAGALIGILLASFAVAVLSDVRDPIGDLLFAGVVALFAVAFALPSVWMLVALHRTGRTLTKAAAFWAALPYRDGRRTPTKGDWFAVRFLGFSSDLFPRLLTTALAALAAIFCVSLLVRGIALGNPVSELFAFAGAGVLFVAVCIGQFGGVQRLQNAYLARDPAALRHR